MLGPMSSNHQPDQKAKTKQKATSGEEPGEEAKCIEGEGNVDAGQTLHPVHLEVQILLSENSKTYFHYILGCFSKTLFSEKN